MSIEKHPLHLKIPELQQSEEVKVAVEKKERLSEDKLPNDPSERIETYMDRLECFEAVPEDSWHTLNSEFVFRLRHAERGKQVSES